MMEHLRDLISKSKPGDKHENYTFKFADDVSYTDPVDGSVAAKQGLRFVFTYGSRIMYRLSGTGSAGATVRVYIEQFEPDVSKHDMDAQTALKPLIDIALSVAKLNNFTGREKPTVIT
ncbi:phosphoglucomutase, chloroplastic-like [Ananas comosus]|uniref:Phosphoglucomutase, chloroplastic-like n=1 Tax=Ananas comosus TaxID=4615 RepID=A0A6P5EFZ3_ANACO|nr:phosphoglucomutase, chloroplastic-like [Ananas comosus]XP_020080538.1 phosphoglucomutase, chloroplastic-like [Ananas comosus]